MAITKTKTLVKIDVLYGVGEPGVQVHEQVTIDDPDDNTLPITHNSLRSIERVSRTTTYDETSGEPTVTEVALDWRTDEDPQILAVCDAVWADSAAE